MSGPVLQNFSIPAGDDVELDFTLTPANSGAEIGPGAQIYFSAFEQTFGVVAEDIPPVIEKVLDHGIEITDPDTKKFSVTVAGETDTILLLGNYYYEAQVVDLSGKTVTATQGIMTVTQTEIRH